MPKPKQHQEKADDNRAFLNTILDSGPPEWIAIVAFYTAVHCVEKMLAYRGFHSRNHEERNEFVRKQFRSIHLEFHELYNHSLVARYHTRGKFTLNTNQAKTILVDDFLDKIEQCAIRDTNEHTTHTT